MTFLMTVLFFSWRTIPAVNSSLCVGLKSSQKAGLSQDNHATIAYRVRPCLACKILNMKGPLPCRNIGDPSPPAASLVSSGTVKDKHPAGSFQVSPA